MSPERMRELLDAWKRSGQFEVGTRRASTDGWREAVEKRKHEYPR